MIYCPKSEMKKILWLDEEDSVVGSRSDPNDKIATDLGSKSTTRVRNNTDQWNLLIQSEKLLHFNFGAIDHV